MKYTLDNLTPSLRTVLAIVHIYPDGATTEDIMVSLGISSSCARSRLTALLRSDLVTYEWEGNKKIWYPYEAR